MNDNKKYDIFISYSVDDFDVERIAQYLEDLGIEVWFDKWSLVPGQRWQTEIERAIESSYTIGVFVGPSLFSDWQQKELKTALQKQEQERSPVVIPILLPGATVDHVPSFLRDLPFLDLRNNVLEPAQLINLVAVIANAKQSEEWAKEQLIGDAFRKLGDYRKAIFHYKRTLEICRQIFGADHPSTLTSMNNLAATLRVQGDLAGARELQEQVLEIMRQILGDEHPETLTSMNNLALTLSDQGDLAGAQEIQEQVLEIMHRILGDEHPDTLTSMNNLATTLYAQGDLAGAQEIQEQVLEIMHRILGSEHPSTLTSMNNLALTLRAHGDLVGARKIHEQVLEISRRILGDEHPDTSMSAWNLFYTYNDMGDFAGAKAVLETDLLWLLDRDPASLGADQQKIRKMIIQIREKP